jgi:hypothetical protein
VVDAVGWLIVLGFVGLLVGLFVVLSLFLLGIIFAFSFLLVIAYRLGGRLLALRRGCYGGWSVDWSRQGVAGQCLLTFGGLGFGIIVCCLGILFLLLFLGVIAAGFFILGVLVPKVADVSCAARVGCGLRQRRAHVIAKRLPRLQDNGHVPRQQEAGWESQGEKAVQGKGDCAYSSSSSPSSSSGRETSSSSSSCFLLRVDMLSM